MRYTVHLLMIFYYCWILCSSIGTCTWWVALHIDQGVHVSLAQPLLVGLSITNGNEANGGVLEDQVGARVALRVKHLETRSRVASKIGLQESQRSGMKVWVESFSHTYTKRSSIFKRRKCCLNIMMRSNGKVLVCCHYWVLFLTSRPVLSGQIHVIGALQTETEIHSSHADLLFQSCCALIKVCHVKIESVAMWARAKPNFLNLTDRFQLTWDGGTFSKRNI